MGKVTEYLYKAIEKQVNEHGLVVWYDPESHYKEAVTKINLPGIQVAKYEGSFFALRHQIDPLLENSTAPRLVVYLPLDQSKTFHSLIELEAGGVVMQPGQQPPELNTRLSLIAREALKAEKAVGDVTPIVKQVEEGKLTLSDLDKLAEKGGSISKGVVSLIFGTGNPQDVALAFLNSEQYDQEVILKDAGAELSELFLSSYEVALPLPFAAGGWRLALSRHILQNDLLSNIQGDLPTKLATIKTTSHPAYQNACKDTAREWRLRRDLRDSYATWSNRIEQELHLTQVDFKLELLKGVDTFGGIETLLQSLVEKELVTHTKADLVKLAGERKSSFWSELVPSAQARWALIETAGNVLLEANRVETALKAGVKDVKTIFEAYTDTANPWCLLDTYYRNQERRYHEFDFDSGNAHIELEKLINKARDRYTQVTNSLAQQFLEQYKTAKFKIHGAARQAQIFEKNVKPLLGQAKTAYVLVDAMRYEMGRELALSLKEEFEMEMRGAVATVPTITEIGMAALMPIADKSLSIVSVTDGKLSLKIDTTLLKDRKDRINYFKANAGVEIFEAKLEDLLSSPKKKVKDGIQAAGLVLITSQEIDALCEGDNVPLARQTMDGVLLSLQRAFRKLAEFGVKHIVVSADHGYLFGEELGDDMKIEAPGGKTYDLHRRVWVGQGGSADPAYMRASLSEFGLGGDLEIAVPWNLACFKAKGGAKAYFHGGMSPQELIIPLISLKAKKVAEGIGKSQINWTLQPGSKKISTRFFSVQIKGFAGDLLPLEAPQVRLEVQVGGKAISRPISASYGFQEATGNVQFRLSESNSKELESNTITLMIDETTEKVAEILLLDAISGAELGRLGKIEMVIAI